MTEVGGIALLRLLQLVSPALPVGAYAYSQGLEAAVEAGWVRDEASLRDWLFGVLEHSLCRIDLPLLARLQRAWTVGDDAALEYWAAWLMAQRESAELQAEDRHLGLALARLLAELDIAAARTWIAHPDIGWPVMFALAAARWEIPPAQAQYGYSWAWCENQVAVALKLMPIGQTAGQRLLSECARRLPALTAQAAGLADADIGQMSPGLAIASARHETQYTRLFRS
ncbi:MAG: urease accessory protein UreF [Gammaproteobacteria bacterium]